MIIDFCTVIFWTVLLAALPFYSLTNSTARPFAPPPFRGSLTVIALRQRCAPLHGGVGLAPKKSLLGFFWGLQKLKLLHAAKPPSVAFYVLARKKGTNRLKVFRMCPVILRDISFYIFFRRKLTEGIVFHHPVVNFGIRI